MFLDLMPDSTSPHATTPAAANAPYRRLILALIAIGAIGLLVELLLLEHFEDPWQWAPVVSLALTVVTSGLLLVHQGRAALRAFQVVMGACVLFGAIGVVLHLQGNIEFELEGKPDLRGWPLYWEALRGAVPALSPGALAQLGLLGLLYAYRHPAITASSKSRPSTEQE